MNNLNTLNKIKSPEIFSTLNLIEGFVAGSLHDDYQNEILARIEQMRDFNEECSSKEYLETRGGIKALRMCLNLFNEMIENKLTDMEERDES